MSVSTFTEQEDVDGVRCTWQYWRQTKAAQAKLPVPPAALVTLLKDIPELPILQYAPVRCKKCTGILNCHCKIDTMSKQWTCPLCSTAQGLPTAYSSITPDHLPAELYPNMNCVEYILPHAINQAAPLSPIILLVIDLCMGQEDMELMKLSLETTIAGLPPNTTVGVITFGALVYVHEMSTAEVARSHLFRGDRETTKEKYLNTLGVATTRGMSAAPESGAPRCLAPLGECGGAVDAVLEGLVAEGATTVGQRTKRGTGAALSVAIDLIECCSPAQSGGRVMLFTAGACTLGPGQIVTADMEESIRTHKDLLKSTAPFYMKALTFYDQLAERLVEDGMCLDILACSLDQTGLSEMQHMVSCTGGVMVMAETFNHDVYTRSLARILRIDPSTGCLAMALNATVEVIPSPHIAIRGACGPLASLERSNARVSPDKPIGLGATSVWKVNALDSGTTVAVYFDVTATDKTAPPAGAPIYIQVMTTYQHACGDRRMRVCTSSRYWTDAASEPSRMGFDQDVAAVAISRWAAFSADTMDAYDMNKWVDTQLISLTSLYCTFTKDVEGSLHMPPDFETYPEYMFHLRRSAFLDVFNNTPDETAYYRLLLSREPVSSCVLMLQPRLYSYTCDGGGAPVQVRLDVDAIDPQAVMILDSWFNVVVHTGTHIAAWRRQGYLESAEYAHVGQVVEQAHGDAQAIISMRTPLPRLVVCDQGTSQARFLLVRLNPSRTHETHGDPNLESGDQIIYTDDVPYDVFVAQLRKLIISG